MFNTSFLFASLIWSSVGFGYFLYGKKQGSWVPMTGGIALMVVSYVGGTALIMTLISLLILVIIHLMLKQGF